MPSSGQTFKKEICYFVKNIGKANGNCYYGKKLLLRLQMFQVSSLIKMYIIFYKCKSWVKFLNALLNKEVGQCNTIKLLKAISQINSGTVNR